MVSLVILENSILWISRVVSGLAWGCGVSFYSILIISFDLFCFMLLPPVSKVVMDNHKGRIGVMSKQPEVSYPTSVVVEDGSPVSVPRATSQGTIFFIEIDVCYTEYHNFGKSSSHLNAALPIDETELPSLSAGEKGVYTPSTQTDDPLPVFPRRSSRSTRHAVVPLANGTTVDEFELPAVWKRGLIVDDVASNRKMLGRIVKSRFEVLDYAVNGQEAVDLVGATLTRDVEDSAGIAPYDIIFMDCNMPIMVSFLWQRTWQLLLSPNPIDNLVFDVC